VYRDDCQHYLLHDIDSSYIGLTRPTYTPGGLPTRGGCLTSLVSRFRSNRKPYDLSRPSSPFQDFRYRSAHNPITLSLPSTLIVGPIRSMRRHEATNEALLTKCHRVQASPYIAESRSIIGVLGQGHSTLPQPSNATGAVHLRVCPMPQGPLRFVSIIVGLRMSLSHPASR
jgi:hypothetical protein